MTDFKKWFAARARNPNRITLEEAFNAGKQSALSLASGDVSLTSESKTQSAPSVPDGFAWTECLNAEVSR